MTTTLLVAGSWLVAAAAFVLLALRVLHPHHRVLAFSLYLASWVPFAAATWRHRAVVTAQARAFESQVDGHGLALLVLGVALAGVGVLWVLFPVERSPMRRLEDDEICSEVDADLRLVASLDRRQRALVEELTASATPGVRPGARGRDERDRVRAAWAAFVEASFELDVLKRRHRTFFRVNGFTRPVSHAEVFLAGYGALVAQYRNALILTRRVGTDTFLKTLLDQSDPDAGLPSGSYSRLQALTVRPDIVLQLNAGRAYLRLMHHRLSRLESSVAPIKASLHDVDDVVGHAPEVLVENPLGVLDRGVFRAWFPVQAKVAVQLSEVRASRRPYCIRLSDVASILPRLRPGDILLQRREWHLTNLGIPGFWTHAALYLGTPRALDDFFAGLAGGPRASERLAREHPAVARELGRPAEDGHPRAVLEALRAGVVLTSLEQSATADSLAVLRPRVPRADLLEALLEACAHHGKPYDFNFDFTTDGELVCSELVMKAFARVDGLHLEPREVNGRLVLPPNAIARKYDLEADESRSELEFVLFLDGDLRTGRPVERDAAELRRSWRRPKWPVVLG